MPLEPFDLICPEIGSREFRVCTVPREGLGMPPGDYILRFNHIIQDRNLVAAFRRHYASAKATVDP